MTVITVIVAVQQQQQQQQQKQQEQPQKCAGLTGTGPIMKLAQIHKYTNTHTVQHTYTYKHNNNLLLSLKYLCPRDVTAHIWFYVIYYYLPYFLDHKTHFFPEKCDLNSTCVLYAEGKYLFPNL